MYSGASLIRNSNSLTTCPHPTQHKNEWNVAHRKGREFSLTLLQTKSRGLEFRKVTKRRHLSPRTARDRRPSPTPKGRSPSLSHPRTQSLSLSHTHFLSPPPTHCLPLSHTLSHTHTLSLLLSRSLALSLSPGVAVPASEQDATVDRHPPPPRWVHLVNVPTIHRVWVYNRS